VNQYSVFQYPPYDIALANKMAEVIKREKLDILHVHYAIPHAVCAILAKHMSNRDIKIVTTLHGTDITVLGYDPSLTDAIKFGIEKSDVVTAVSKALVEQTNELIVQNKPIQTVYNFVDERIYHKRDAKHLREEFEIKEDEKVIIHVSNFRTVKRVQDVVKAFANISSAMPSRLLLVGDGPEMTRVCKQVRELNLEDLVLFLGKQENLEELYSISDLMLLLSEKESFGLVALEAMACGVPCIGTNTGGLPEVVTHQQTGFICEVGDIEDISTKAIQLLSDKALHQSYSQQSIETVKSKFSADRIVEQYEQIYFELMN
jgi:N-acetyl-alpha-D-glucosaminyl L-malate synthase BshA